MNEETFNSRVIVFVGAGASAELGMPTTSQFIELLSQHWTNLSALLDAYRKYSKSASPFDKTQPAIDSEYLRDWLLELRRSAESIQVLSQHEPFKTSVSRTDHAVQFIDKILADFDLFTRNCYKDPNPDKAYQHYLPLLDWLRSNEINVVPLFTTNYDLVFESMQDCEKCKWHIETGMHKTGRRVVLDTKLYDQFNSNLPTLIIYKLHGSTDWWMNNDNNQIQQIPLDHKAPENCRDLLIYPTRSKFEKVKEKPFSFYYERLKAHLSSEGIRACIAIGYSFRDEFINSIFVESLRKGLKLIIIDKSMKQQQLMTEFSSYELDSSIIDNIRIHNLEFGNWQHYPNNKVIFSQILNDELGNDSNIM